MLTQITKMKTILLNNKSLSRKITKRSSRGVTKALKNPVIPLILFTLTLSDLFYLLHYTRQSQINKLLTLKHFQ